MDFAKLTTTIVSGLMALGMVASLTVLLVSGVTVPGFYEPTIVLLAGAAVGGARAAG